MNHNVSNASNTSTIALFRFDLIALAVYLFQCIRYSDSAGATTTTTTTTTTATTIPPLFDPFTEFTKDNVKSTCKIIIKNLKNEGIIAGVGDTDAEIDSGVDNIVNKNENLSEADQRRASTIASAVVAFLSRDQKVSGHQMYFEKIHSWPDATDQHCDICTGLHSLFMKGTPLVFAPLANTVKGQRNVTNPIPRRNYSY